MIGHVDRGSLARRGMLLPSAEEKRNQSTNAPLPYQWPSAEVLPASPGARGNVEDTNPHFFSLKLCLKQKMEEKQEVPAVCYGLYASRLGVFSSRKDANASQGNAFILWPE